MQTPSKGSDKDTSIFIIVNYFLYSAIVSSMTLPEVCPLDETQTCKGRECHLFCLEWRTREPNCLIGYGTTSKIKSGKVDRNRDTYAEDTFRKLGRQPLSKRRKNVSEKGDWIPRRLAEEPAKRPAERKEASLTQSQEFQEIITKIPEGSKKTHDERLRERYNASEIEKTSGLESSRLREEPAEQNPIICARTQPRIQEKPRIPEKVISRDKHTTIFTPFDTDKKDNSYLPRREEAKKPPENREKRKKLDKVIEIDLPDTYEEDFWS